MWANLVPTISGQVLQMFLDVKGMRKLRSGDRIELAMKGSATDVADVLGAITTFCKLA